jgi:hypothetical protein
MEDGELASWIDGPAKASIQDFVAKVTTEGGRQFVSPDERIAVFDNDGTLWCEQPLQVQFYFGHDRLKVLATRNRSLRTRQPFKAFLEHDLGAIKELGKRGLFETAAVAHAGLTEDAFLKVARDWLAKARHPTLGRLFTELVYQPQLELLSYLRRRGFTIYIVSGGGVDLIRAFSGNTYGVPTAQVIGSSVKTRFEMQGGRGELVKLPELESFNDSGWNLRFAPTARRASFPTSLAVDTSS